MDDYKKYEPFFGAWYITKLIGKGSFGRVYEISRQEFGMEYKAALKIISVPQDEDEVKARMTEGTGVDSISQYYEGILKEIVNENMLMSKLKGNSNIVSYEDHQIIPHEDGIGYDVLIRMELLTPLIDLMLQRKLDEKEVVKLGIDLCKALELCHRKNIIHRDIKPQNIFVSETGDFKLGDFGIARTMEKTSGNMSKKGTYKYMAPEVFRGDHYDQTADLYSLGIVLFSLMNGNRGPFLPAPPAPVSHTQEEDARMRRLRGEPIPAPKDAGYMFSCIIQKACEANPAKRYQTAGQMKRDLESYLTHYDEQSKVTAAASTPQFTPKQVTQDPSQYGPQRPVQSVSQPKPQSAPQRPAQPQNATQGKPQYPPHYTQQMAAVSQPQGTAGARPQSAPQRPAQPQPQNTAQGSIQNTQHLSPVPPSPYVNPRDQLAAMGNKKKKKSKAGLIIGIIAAVVVIALVAIAATPKKPYLEPIDKLFKAYNNNDIQLLSEAVSPELYDYWNLEAVADVVNDDSYEVVYAELLSGEDLEDAKLFYGVTECYSVTVDDRIYDPDDGRYYTFREIFYVGKLNNEWRIVDVQADE